MNANVAQQVPTNVAQNAVAGQAAPQEIPNIQIVPSSSGTSFIIKGVKGNKELKKTIISLGGSRNSRGGGGYIFPARDLQRVCEALGLQSGVNLVDPRKTVEVTFTEKLQWAGDMASLEAYFKSIGMVKENGKMNSWHGNMAQAAAFAKVSNVSSAAPAPLK